MGVFIRECRLSNGLLIRSDSRTPVHELFKEIYRTEAYSHSAIPGVRENDVVIDLGANIGMFSLFAASVSSTVQVQAFEPVPETFALLKQNVLDNGFANIQYHQCAVSSRTGEQALYIDAGSTVDTAIESLIKAPETARKETLPCISLDDLFIRHAIDSCHFLKCDVEGSEFEIFFAASPKTMDKIRTIAMEYHEHEGRRGRELEGLLLSHDFSVTVVAEPRTNRGMIYATKRHTNGDNGN